MKKFITKFVISTMLIATYITPLQAKDVSTQYGDTPYDHIPIDTFVAGFPLEAFIMLGLIAYIVGAVYIFNSVLLRQTIK